MKRILMALMTLGAAVALSTALASPASAAPDLGAASTCWATAEENRAVWAEPGTSDGTVGSVIANQTYATECALVEGESYSACGSTTSLWAYVNYAADRWGYVPSSCVRSAS
ncbi:hypothetical protein [Glycomyces tarimensis]